MDDLMTAISYMTIKDSDTFCTLLKSLNKKQLNTFDETQVAQPLRRFVHGERTRRKTIRNETGQTNIALHGLEAITDGGFVEEVNNLVAQGNGSQPGTGNGGGGKNNKSKKKGKKNGSNNAAAANEPKKKKTKNVGSSSMYPELHRDVAAEIPDEIITFNTEDTEHGMEEHWNTNIVGSFRCRKCGRPWRSGIIATQIRHYGGGEYNAKVFHQRCEKCNTTARPELDKEIYAERVSYWVKKWMGHHVVVPDHRDEKRTPPHRSELCEGCKHGCCRYSGYN